MSNLNTNSNNINNNNNNNNHSSRTLDNRYNNNNNNDNDNNSSTFGELSTGGRKIPIHGLETTLTASQKQRLQQQQQQQHHQLQQNSSASSSTSSSIQSTPLPSYNMGVQQHTHYNQYQHYFNNNQHSNSPHYHYHHNYSHHHQQQQQHYPNNFNQQNLSFIPSSSLSSSSSTPSPPQILPTAPSMLYSTTTQTSNSMFTGVAGGYNHHPYGHYPPHHNHHHHNQNNKKTNSSNINVKDLNRPSIVYVYELPYNIRKSICDLLDADNSWRELGGRYMSFNDTQLTLISHALYRSASPTNELLTKWESSNAKISHLFIYLAKMKHHRALYYLLPFVNDKLRSLYEASNNENPNVDGNGNNPNNSDHIFDSFYNRTKMNENSTSFSMLMSQQSLPLSPSASLSESSSSSSTLKSMNFNNKDNMKQSINSKIDPHHHHHHNHRKCCKINEINNQQPEDEEHTLVDLDQNTKKAKQLKPKNENKADKIEIEDYLLKIDDFKISYKELAIATEDFSKDNVLGSGGFGTVYIGDWKGTKVAIKKLKGLDNLTQAFTELRILNCCRIDNILPLYAVSLDGPEPCLVYQYMSNGSLEDRLLCKKNTPPLTWIQRAKIGEGVAKALNFLHTLKGNPFIHGDVKSANILLDPMFEPKLGDFGLARQVVKNDRNDNSIYTHCTVSSVNGTSVYLPAEYLRQKILSPAVDVYSYGIVILEMATGRRAYDGKKLLINSVEDEYTKVQNASLQIQSTKLSSHHHNNQKSEDSTNNNNEEIKTLEFLMDKRIVNQSEGRYLFNYLLELGRRCAHKTKSKRPIMIQILEYFNQCRATERIYQLCDKVIQNKMLTLSTSSTNEPVIAPATSTMNNQQQLLSKINVKTPIELQLWYDFVRKSCGTTLSEIVFENFDAQVTKIIEDFASASASSLSSNATKSSASQESNYYLDLLLCSKNRIMSNAVRKNSEQMSSSFVNKINNDNRIQTTSFSSNTPESSALSSSSSSSESSCSISSSSQSLSSMTQSSSLSSSSFSASLPNTSKQSMTNLSTDDGNKSNESSSFNTTDDDLSKILKFINLNNCHNKQDDNDDNVDEIMNQENSQQQQQQCDYQAQQPQQQQPQQQHSTPFIPLLTALGFDTTDLDQIIDEQN